MTLGIYMFIQLWNSFPEKLKTKKIIYTNATEDLFLRKKWYKIISIAKVQKMSTMLQGKTYILLTFPTIKKIKMTAKEFYSL